MFRGFSLTVNNNEFPNHFLTGDERHKSQKSQVKSTLNSFVDSRKNLIASKITANWFPEIDSHVFIAHSHKDSDLAIRLSGWLDEIFGLTSFIDSCVWGYSDDLLRMIDNEYCWQEHKKTYNYNKRNRSTSHVHMMLSTAISKMMNNCECIIFLNTPSSISTEKYIEGGITDSPWIYSEIAMTGMIQKRTPDQHRNLLKSIVATESSSENFRVKYDVDLSHLTKLTKNDLCLWERNVQPSKRGVDALEELYKLK